VDTTVSNPSLARRGKLAKSGVMNYQTTELAAGFLVLLDTTNVLGSPEPGATYF